MENLLASLSFGFFGSFHCLGMCGGFSTAVTSQISSGKKKLWPGLLLYQAGRILVYSLAGLVIGLGSEFIFSSGSSLIQKAVAGIAGLFMVLMGLNLTGLIRDPFEKLTKLAYRKIGLSERFRGFTKKDSFFNWFFLGLLNGFLPCGLVYAALLISLSAPNLFHSFFTMVFFGLGTVPAMIFAPALLKTLSPKLRVNMIKLSGALLIAFGIFTVYRGTFMATHIHNKHTIEKSGVMKDSCEHPEMSRPGTISKTEPKTEK